MNLTRRASVALAVVGTVVGIGLVAGPASAAHRDGLCNSSAYSLDSRGEFCLYYSPNLAGSLHDQSFAYGNDANLQDNYFISSGAGRGLVVRNEAASANNRYYGGSVFVHYSPNFMGTSVPVGSMNSTNLGVLRNENASYRWTE